MRNISLLLDQINLLYNEIYNLLRKVVVEPTRMLLKKINFILRLPQSMYFRKLFYRVCNAEYYQLYLQNRFYLLQN